MPIPGHEHGDPGAPKSRGEGPVGGRDPGSSAYRRVQDRFVSTTLDGEDGVAAGQSDRGARPGNPAGEKAVKLLEHRGRNGDLRSGSDPQDLRFQGKLG